MRFLMSSSRWGLRRKGRKIWLVFSVPIFRITFEDTFCSLLIVFLLLQGALYVLLIPIMVGSYTGDWGLLRQFLPAIIKVSNIHAHTHSTW